MITLCIRYTLDPAKLADFAAYARGLAEPIARSGGKLVGYFQPTKFAGPTNAGLALIEFPSLAAYEQYREKLAADGGNAAVAARAEEARCILLEDRTIVQRVA